MCARHWGLLPAQVVNEDLPLRVGVDPPNCPLCPRTVTPSPRSGCAGGHCWPCLPVPSPLREGLGDTEAALGDREGDREGAGSPLTCVLSGSTWRTAAARAQVATVKQVRVDRPHGSRKRARRARVGRADTGGGGRSVGRCGAGGCVALGTLTLCSALGLVLKASSQHCRAQLKCFWNFPPVPDGAEPQLSV